MNPSVRNDLSDYLEKHQRRIALGDHYAYLHRLVEFSFGLSTHQSG